MLMVGSRWWVYGVYYKILTILFICCNLEKTY